MPPNVRSVPLGELLPANSPFRSSTDLPSPAVSVTLTPIRGSGLVRTITLKPGEPVLIGRASKSTLKNLEPRSNNALFDCPVISREHAELRAHLWDVVENQITITDKGSMHGTRVNGAKLREGQPKTLRSGDAIQFGEKVTRADSVFDLINDALNTADPHSVGSHDGVFVTFHRQQNFTQESNTLADHPATNPSGVYRYPYTSDEDSDYESDDIMSILSDAGDIKEVSSAKTTPEQAKAQLGTQEQPIELDQPEKAKVTLVQDSLDAQASVLVPESMPRIQRMATSNHVDEGDSDDDSVVIRQDHVVSQPRAASFVSIEADVDESSDAEDADKDIDEHLDDVSVSVASELNDYKHLEELDGDQDPDEVEQAHHISLSPEPANEPSPELRSSGQNHPSAVPLPGPYMCGPSDMSAPWAKSTSNQYEDGTRSRFLPASQPAAYSSTLDCGPPPFNLSGQSSAKVPFNNTIRFDDFGAPANVARTRPSMPTVSRWDKPPSFARFDTTYPFANTYTSGRELYNQYPASSVQPPADPFGFSHSWSGMPPVNSSFTAMGSPNGYTPQSPKLTPPMVPPTTRISIPDIVDKQQDMDPEVAALLYPTFNEELTEEEKEAKVMLDQAKAMVDHAEAAKTVVADSSPVSASTRSTKRKAEDDDVVPTSSAPTESAVMHDGLPAVVINVDGEGVMENSAGHTTLSHISFPPSKRMKTSNASSVSALDGPTASTTSTLAAAGSMAGSIAKYAAVASAGGAGMLAFLCSPASEKLLTWLT